MRKKLISIVITAGILISSISSMTILAKSFNAKQNVALDHSWTVKLNKTLGNNQDFSGISIKDTTGNIVPVSVSVGADKETLNIAPKENYNSSTTYTLTVDGIKGSSGENLKENDTLNFTTVASDLSQSFSVKNINSGNTTSVDPNSSIVITLNKNVDTSTLSGIAITDKEGNKANVKVSALGNKLTIAPSNNFWDDTKTIEVPRNAYKCNTTYSINLGSVKSEDGQDISTKSYSFTTRDYKFNPTIQGICNDDYISFGNQYASEMWNITDPKTGYPVMSLWQAHDNKGTLILDNKTHTTPEQITNNWNPYANIQNRNLYNLQVEIRKEYKKILAKHSEYTGFNLGFLQDISSDQYTGIEEYDFKPYILDINNPETFEIWSIYKSSPDKDSINTISCGGVTQEEQSKIADIVKNQKPQFALDIGGMDNSPKFNLTRLAMYQTLYCVFGGDYAGEIYDYIITNNNKIYGVYETSGQIGNIKIDDMTGTYLFKY